MSRVPAEILAIIEGQREALEQIAPEQRARLLAIAREVADELEAQLKTMAPGRYTTQQTRVILAQVRAVTEVLGAELGERLGGAVEDIGAAAARIGRNGLLAQIEAWAPEFGTVGRVAPVELAGDLLDEGLLEYYQVSRQTYGMEAIRKMRETLARSVMSGETLNQTTERLQADIEISETRAERIVRTESSFAMHRRQLEDAKAADLGMVKQLLATFDNRTGDDSRSVHEQVRELDEPFEDNEGRRYQHPPNRPNDREAMVFVPRAAIGMEAVADAGGPDESLEWDEDKRARNLAKHKLDLADARWVLDSPHRMDVVEQRGDETRIVSFAYVPELDKVLQLVYVRRGNSIRPISYRPASRNERKKYHARSQPDDLE